MLKPCKLCSSHSRRDALFEIGWLYKAEKYYINFLSPVSSEMTAVKTLKPTFVTVWWKVQSETGSLFRRRPTRCLTWGINSQWDSILIQWHRMLFSNPGTAIDFYYSKALRDTRQDFPALSSFYWIMWRQASWEAVSSLKVQAFFSGFL